MNLKLASIPKRKTTKSKNNDLKLINHANSINELVIMDLKFVNPLIQIKFSLVWSSNKYINWIWVYNYDLRFSLYIYIWAQFKSIIQNKYYIHLNNWLSIFETTTIVLLKLSEFNLWFSYFLFFMLNIIKCHSCHEKTTSNGIELYLFGPKIKILPN